VRIAFLGTGTMGTGMARNLLAAGHDLAVWNRTRAKAEAIEGATVADGPAAAAKGADVLVTMLSDGPTVASVTEPLGGFDGIWLQMSTVGVDWTNRLAARYSPFVDAPVLGSRVPAEEGTLTVLAAGPRDERAERVFDAVGSTTVWLGEPPAATKMKLVFNAYVLLSIAALGQAIDLARRLGSDPRAFLDVVKGTGVDSFYGQTRGATMIDDDFSPNFPLELARKDLALALEAADGDAELVAAALELYDRSLERGHGREDMTAVIKGLGQPAR
jgi:3-hydroxyisobutyrate dehydrogenase